jgi:hypothetical protein
MCIGSGKGNDPSGLFGGLGGLVQQKRRFSDKNRHKKSKYRHLKFRKTKTGTETVQFGTLTKRKDLICP